MGIHVSCVALIITAVAIEDRVLRANQYITLSLYWRQVMEFSDLGFKWGSRNTHALATKTVSRPESFPVHFPIGGGRLLTF